MKYTNVCEATYSVSQMFFSMAYISFRIYLIFLFFKFRMYIIISRISLYSRHLYINSLCLFSVNIYGLRFVSRQVDITGNPLISPILYGKGAEYFINPFFYIILSCQYRNRTLSSVEIDLNCIIQ